MKSTYCKSALSLLVIFTLTAPSFATIVYTGSEPVTLALEGGTAPPTEQATISICGCADKWDDFIVSLEYINLTDPMSMSMMGRTRLKIFPGMAMGMPARIGHVVGVPLTMMGQPVNLASNLRRRALIGSMSPLVDYDGLGVLLCEGQEGQTINGEFGEGGGYIGLVLPGSSYYGWLHVAGMSDVGMSTQSVTFDGSACETVDGAAIRAGDTGVIGGPGEHVKWSQPPIEIDPSSKTPIYCGWDEPCFWSMDKLRLQWLMAADDFRCIGTMPIASVRWWGSYKGWDNPKPPAPSPLAWRISFWSNEAADPTGKPAFSYPKQLLWQVEVAVNRVRQQYVGIDSFPQRPSDTCFEYYVQLKPEEYFWQHKYETATQDSVFWISIAPLYPELLPVEFPLWGWKTRPWHWLDSAVKLDIDGEPKVGTMVGSFQVSPIKDKTICGVDQSYDMAFEIDTDPLYVKWEQAFTGIRNWPHYEDEESLAIEKSDGTIEYRRLVADDWKCRDQTPVTAMVWWGSYIGYQLKVCECEQMPRPVRPDYFLVSIWTDVPDPNPNNPQDYSHPGTKVWEYKAYELDEVLVGYDKHPYAATTPIPPTMHEPVFRYSVKLPKDTWFYQKTISEVYWLSIAAVYKNPAQAIYPWGWTNHQCTQWDPPGLEPVLHWRLDETTGNMASDSSGNGNHGTLVGDASWQGCCGMTCGALLLDGDGDYVKVDSPVGLDFAPGSFTASAWIRATKVKDGWRTIMEYDRDGGDRNRFGMWLSEEGRFHFRVGWNAWNTTQKLNANEWYMLTGTYDSKTKKFNMYVNGQLDIEVDLEKGFTSANVAKLTVGVRGSEDGEYFDGLVDDVRIFDYALSSDDIEALFGAARNDDAVEGYVDPTVLTPIPGWQWRELHDQVGTSQDMSFMLFTEPGCFPRCHEDYLEWISVGRPECWCYPRQCHGDADGKSQGSAKAGVYYVGTNDLNILLAAWQVKEPPKGPGIASIPDGICADFAHDVQGSAKVGLMRVGTNDLNILVSNWLVKEQPQGPGVAPDCLECPGLVTSRPVCTTQCPAVETRCPSLRTACPAVETQCPPVATRCPAVQTQCVAMTMCPPQSTTCPALLTTCPAVETKCPTAETKCPMAETRCPPVATKCPPVQTQCVAITMCPPQSTTCPALLTTCPVVETECPPVETRCPLGETRCPPIETKCPLAQTKCPMVDTKCPLTETKCPMTETRCPPKETWCPVSNTKCPVTNTKCPVTDTQCPVVDTKCPTKDTLCPVYDTRCPPVPSRCPPSATTCAAPAPTQCPIETQCPQVLTQCPPVFTQCVGPQTQCPVETQCPPVQTRCPPVQSRCPPTATTCGSPTPTQCPPVDTQCPVETQCPPVQTKCPFTLTACYEIPTVCPAPTTICSGPSCVNAGPGGSREPTWYGLVVTSCPAIEAPCAFVPAADAISRLARLEAN